jgi:hypothetical protein
MVVPLAKYTAALPFHGSPFGGQPPIGLGRISGAARADPAHVIPVTNVIESSFATIRPRTVRILL